MHQLRKAWTLGLGATLLVASIHQAITAGQPEPGGDAIGCTVSGADVSIAWSVDFIAPIHGWVIARDGQPIAELESSAKEYLDRAVPAGEHTYEVTAINFDGSAIHIGACTVRTGDFGIDCAALPDGAVRISWQILIDIAISAFIVTRNDEVIANLPPSTFEFQDTSPGPGRNRYGVEAETAGGHIFVVGACTIPPERGLICSVDGMLVHLDWSHIPLPLSPWSHFAVLRDGAVIAETRETGYTDSPGPGEHLYAIALVFDDTGASKDVIGSCTVTVEGQPAGDLLFFSTSLAAPAGTSEVTCLERSTAGIQGWSFGVKSDPAFLAPLSVSLEDTATSRLNDGAGPTFLSVNILPDGVTMAAIVDEEDTGDTLPPPDFGHPLAHIRYGAGPLGVPGDVHPIAYSEGLGDPAVAVVFVVNGFEVRPATLGGFVVLEPGEAKYLRGDSNGDGIFDISDPVHTLGYLFLGSAPPPCLEAADANATREINIADAVYGLQHLFGENGPPPPPPFPECEPGPVFLGCGAQGC